MKLYRLDAEDINNEDIRLVSALFPRRFERALRMAKRGDGLCVIAAGALLYHVLGADERGLSATAGGKPFIEGGPCFSLSHSGGRCVLAVCGGPVGVDIERLDESNLIAARAALTEEELSWIEPDPLVRFHLLWTRKESVFKAVGGYEEPRDIPALEGRLPAGLFAKSMLWGGFALSVCSFEEPGDITPEPLKRT